MEAGRKILVCSKCYGELLGVKGQGVKQKNGWM